MKHIHYQKIGFQMILVPSLLFWLAACEDRNIENTEMAPPSLSAEHSEIAIDLGTSMDIPVSIQIPGGYASSDAHIASGSGEVSIVSTPSLRDTSGTIVLTYEAKETGQASISLTVTDGQETPKSATMSMTMTTNTPFEQEYANAMDMISSRPDLSDMALLIDRAGLTEAFRNNEIYDTFFPAVNGSFDAFLDMSPFYETLEELPKDVANSLIDLLRGRFRIEGRETSHGINYEAFKLRDFYDHRVSNINKMENRIYGNFALAPDTSGIGFLRNGEFIAQATFIRNDILIGENPNDPVIVAHVIDDLWFDMSLLSEENFPPDGFSAGFMRSEFVPIVMGWSWLPWWPLNGLNGKGEYSGSRSVNGILIVPLDAFSSISDLTPTTDLDAVAEESGRLIWEWPAGSCSDADPNGDSCPGWYPRGNECGCYVPDEDFQAGVEYWKKHTIQMDFATTLENGPINGTFNNMLGDEISIDESSISLGNKTANVIATYHWFDQTGRFTPIESTTQAFIDGYRSLGGMYRVVYVVDASL